MPHMEKVKQANINQVLGHDLRSKNTKFKSADPGLEQQNKYYINTGEGLALAQESNNKRLKKQALEYHERRLAEVSHVKRKDLVSAVEWVVTCPRDLPTSDRQKFLGAAIEFMQERYGAKNAISAAMHYDEPGAMPHLHFVFVPVDERGKVCAKRVMNRTELQKYHPELERYESQALGHPVHILRDEDERTAVSLPLSQYKAETMARAAEEKIQNAQGLLKIALDEAETTAKERYQEIEETGLVGRMRGNYKEVVKESIAAAEQVKAISRAEAVRQGQELAESYASRERSLAADAASNNRQAARNEADKAEIEQARVALEEGLARQAKQAKELQERLNEINRVAAKAEADAKTAERKEKAAKADKAAAEKMKADIAKATAELTAKRLDYAAERGRWLPIEQANKKAADAVSRAETAEQWANTHWDSWQKEKSRAIRLSDDLTTANKELARLRARLNGIDEQYSKHLKAKDVQISELNNTLEIRDNQLNTSMSEASVLSDIVNRKEVVAVLTNIEKAQIRAYREQSAAIEKDEYMHIEPTKRIETIKKQLDKPRGIHRTANSKGIMR